MTKSSQILEICSVLERNLPKFFPSNKTDPCLVETANPAQHRDIFLEEVITEGRSIGREAEGGRRTVSGIRKSLSSEEVWLISKAI